MARQLRAPQHEPINQLDAQAGEEELGATLRTTLADRLRITKGEAGRRINDAADLGQRRARVGGVKSGSGDVKVDGSTYTTTGEATGADIKNPLAGMITKPFTVTVTCK